ncbi:FxSxx-COOH system tetratricopeptide repeat protein [Streptomyces sp. NPDC047042]|uniref:FxSxx-COOH system tetratricopeptide repeat protein n=1 Tax=Streptomyces sp. NPDC047042 TaxID=3154807 RepID=UPI0033EE99B6
MEDARQGEIVTFYSYKGGTGRTMALANIAWILASSGRSVLAVDWDLEAPGLHRYFHPFLIDKELRATSGVLDIFWDFSLAAMDPRGENSPTWYQPYADVLQHAVSLRRDFPGGGNIDLLGAGKQNKSFGARVNSFDWHAFYNRLDGGAFIEALKTNMRQSYDYILIDSRTGLSDTSGICTIQMPDTLVACFTMSSQSIAGCASVAESAVRKRRNENPLRVLPVPMRVEGGETDRLEESRDYARWSFRKTLQFFPLPEREAYWGDVEVPYKSLYAYEEMLAPIGDRPHQEDTVLAACERLTAHLTRGAVTECVAMEEAARRRLRRAYRARPNRRMEYDFCMSYAAADRAWGEWIAAALTAAGMKVFLDPDENSDADWSYEYRAAMQRSARMLVLLSPHYLQAERNLKSEMAFAGMLEADESLKRIIPIKVSQFDSPDLPQDLMAIDVAGLEEDEARDRLIQALGAVVGRVNGRSSTTGNLPQQVRYPYAKPAVWEVPRRPQDFVGRDSELLFLWRQFREPSATVVVTGMPGVGKTALALEYAYRYRGEYDSVRYGGPDELLGASQLREGYRRSLLIVDDVDHDENLLQTPFHGHVIKISRSRTSTSKAPSLPLEVLPSRDAITLLKRRLPSITTKDAGIISSRLGNLPLALQIAVGQLSRSGASVSDYLTLLDHQLDQTLLRSSGDFGRSLSHTVEQDLSRLQKRDPAAGHLLRLLCLVASDPVPIVLIRKAPEAFTPPLRTIAGSSTSLDTTVTTLVRAGLVEYDAQALRTHPVLAAAVRSTMTQREQDELAGELMRMLVANDPGDPSQPEHWTVYRALMPLATRIAWPTDASFRELLLRLCWFQLSTGNPLTARDLADRVSRQFDAQLGNLHEDSLAARHVTALCDLELGDAERATHGWEWLVASRRQLLGEDHPVTLASLNNLAAALAAQSRWTDAIRLHQSIVETREQSLGLDHPDTLLSAGNLASCHYGAGHYQEALELESSVFARRTELLGVDHPATLASMENLAVVCLKTGRAEESVTLLQRALRYRQVSMGGNHPDTLRCAVALAHALRPTDPMHARDLARAIVDDLREVLGTDHHLTQDIIGMAEEQDR